MAKQTAKPLDNGALTREQLTAAIEKDKQQRAEAFRDTVRKAAAEHRCKLNPVFMVSGGQMQTDVQFVALD